MEWITEIQLFDEFILGVIIGVTIFIIAVYLNIRALSLYDPAIYECRLNILVLWLLSLFTWTVCLFINYFTWNRCETLLQFSCLNVSVDEIVLFLCRLHSEFGLGGLFFIFTCAKYSWTSEAPTLMTRLPRLFRTRSWVPMKKSLSCS